MIDPHCHIDMPQFDADRREPWPARVAGVAEMLLVGGVDAEQGHRRALRVPDSQTGQRRSYSFLRLAPARYALGS